MTVQRIYGAFRIHAETGGHVSFDIQQTNSPHKHDYFELCLVLGGSGEYRHGPQKLPLKRGDVFLAEPGVVHEITSFATRDLKLYFIALSAAALAENRLPPSAHPAAPEEQVAAAFLARRQVLASGWERLAASVPLLEQFEQRPAFAAESTLACFALEMMAALSEAPPDRRGRLAEDEVARALAYVDQRLAQGVTVQETAAALGLSERTLRRRFRERSGSSLAQEINHRRMRSAAHRLLMGFGVAEAASYVGIASQAQFTRAFRRAFGVAPKQFQSAYRPGTLGRTTRPEEAHAPPG